jgi:hypothetical protein
MIRMSIKLCIRANVFGTSSLKCLGDIFEHMHIKKKFNFYTLNNYIWEECLIEKRLQRTTLDFCLFYIIIIVSDYCMPIDKMMFS